MSTLFALFLALPTIALPTGNVTAIAPPWVSSPNVRGTADIVLTCLATISLCVYTALHLNVPKCGSTAVDNVFRKAKWVVVGIFAPEIVVYSAFVQLRTVIVFRDSMRKILQEADLEKNKEYTISSTPETDVLDKDREPITVEGETEGAMKMNTQESDPRMRYMVNGPPTASKEAIFLDNRVSWAYAWYVIMGGFVLNVSPLHDYHGVMTLTHHAMLVLAKDGLFLPMSDDSIRDKSKADYLAKALVFFQVSFLVVQTIARKSQALPTSLLEIHTLVHVVCAVGMYVAWIRKPLDIKDPTDISLNIWSNPDLETGLRWQKAIANILVHSHGLSTWSYNGGVPCDLMAETLLAAEYVSFPTFRERNVELISASSTQKDEAQLLDSSFDGLSLKFCTRELVPASIAFFDNLGQSQEQKAMTKKRFEGPPWNPDCVRDWLCPEFWRRTSN
ncbi:hypothetical protein BLS_005231 [Venturia inaequalis]|uniref:Uncharacterized protein n=1 Tax=Venturia inaequalis TaxID=5025 RepID=A0A8H3VQ53_VENIN|nr:hypothetical protein BLS_005231 [Venturia inaequalis]KAE9992491.1 hypothetical protein EG327_008880 [Venturia inaequalis]